MKKLKLAALLVLSGAGIYAPSAHALTYNAGDLLIGFRDSAVSGSDYLIDAGPISTILGFTSPTVLPGLGATGTNLSSVFSGDSSGWFSSGLATWGVAADVTQGNGAVVLYAGSSHSSGSLDSSYNPGSNSNQGTTGTNIDTAGIDYANNGTSVGGAPATNQSTTDTSSWGFLVSNGGSAFGQFVGFENNIPGGLNLYQIFPSSKNNSLGTPSTTLEGSFSIASNGNITYTPAVPEPSALTALAGGAGLLGLIRRRRAVTA